MAKRKSVSDDDAPELTQSDFERARPIEKVVPGITAAAKRARGRPRLEKPKEHVSLRIDPDVLEAFKATFDKGWQTHVANMMTRAVARAKADRRQHKTKHKSTRAA